MLLAQLICERPDEIRADLMEVYGICLDAAMDGAYSAPFVAALCAQLPQDCRWRVSYDKDAWWTGDRLLMASLVNTLRGLVWGMADKRKRGPAPKQVGPRGTGVRTLGRRVMSAAKLLERLARPRRKRREVEDGKH